MGGKGDRFGDRSNLPWMPRHDRPQDEDAYVSLLSGAFYAPGADPEIRMIAEVMASLAPLPPAVVPIDAPPGPRRRAPLATTIGRRIAAVTAAGALAFGGFAAVAYASALPDSVQDVAHHLIGAPAGHHHGTGKSRQTPVGPTPTGAAAQGLCTAYERARVHGSSTDRAVAFAKLEDAAGGASKVSAFCGAVVPGPNAQSSAAPTHPMHTTPAGRPTTTPTQSKGGGGHTGEPSGRPATTTAPAPTPTPPSKTHGPPSSHGTG